MIDSSRETAAEDIIFEEPTYYHTSVIQTFKNTLSYLLRPRVREVDQRITWCCECGEYFYADFKAKSPETMQDIHAILYNVPSAAICKFRGVPTGWPCLLGHEYVSIQIASVDNINAKITSIGLYDIHLFVIDLINTNIFRIDLINFDRSNLSGTLCNHWGESQKKLDEINLVGTKLDEDTFKRIREKYYELRGARSKLWLIKPASHYLIATADHKD
ncbi:hypothetical protein BGAL_0056g00130 [Botrytis galanthina]|uniref:Uncharacterized protein n=1 Tax=Botrytis galanthina TaxID=278940 RepID=A0A4V4HVG8_9HELO|nr:hypothetical protein BGAL_0056g00130 [Botrytis galanthina]